MNLNHPIISIQAGQENLRKFVADPRAQYQMFALKRHLVEAGLTSLGLGGINVVDTDDRMIHYQDKDGSWKDQSRNKLLAQLSDPSFELQPDFPEGEDPRRETVLRTFQGFDELCDEHDDFVDRSHEVQWSWRVDEEKQGMVYFYINTPDRNELEGWHSLEEIQQYMDGKGPRRETHLVSAGKEQ